MSYLFCSELAASNGDLPSDTNAAPRTRINAIPRQHRLGASRGPYQLGIVLSFRTLDTAIRRPGQLAYLFESDILTDSCKTLPSIYWRAHAIDFRKVNLRANDNSYLHQDNLAPTFAVIPEFLAPHIQPSGLIFLGPRSHIQRHWRNRLSLEGVASHQREAELSHRLRAWRPIPTVGPRLLPAYTIPAYPLLLRALCFVESVSKFITNLDNVTRPIGDIRHPYVRRSAHGAI